MKKKLFRIEQEQMIAGVCTGLAEYFDLDVTSIRIAFVVAVLAGASGVLAYIVLWIAVPKRPYLPDYSRNQSDNQATEPLSSPNPAFVQKKKGNGKGRLIAGFIFIFFGTFFLLNEFNLIPNWLEVRKLWPLILIGMGLYTLVGAKKKESRKEDWIKKDEFTKTSSLNPEPVITTTEPEGVQDSSNDQKLN